MAKIQEIDFYEALKIIRTSKEPFNIVHTKLSLSKNEGGERNVLEHVVQGANRKGENDEMMLGLESQDGETKHIYIHTILELVTKEAHYKLIWK